MALQVLDKFEPKDPTALPKIIHHSLIDWDGEEPSGGGSGAFYMEQNNTSAPATTFGVITASKDGFKLVDGAIVALKLKYPLGLGAKLNINDLGSKNIKWRNQSISSITFFAGDTIVLIYDEAGSCWRLVAFDRYGDQGSAYAICKTATSENTKEITLKNYTINIGNLLMIKFENAVNPSAERTFVKFIGGVLEQSLEIMYQGASSNLPISAGSVATFLISDKGGGISFLDLQGVNEVSEDPQQIIIQDSYNYDANDDNAVPTAKAAAEIAKDEIQDAFAESSMTYQQAAGNEGRIVTPKAAKNILDTRVWTGTQTEYDAITTKSQDTIYFIKEA